MEEYSYLLKICLFADKNVGKKILAQSNFVESYFNDDHMSTIGVEFCNKFIDYRKGIKLHLWLISEEKERFQHIRKSFIQGSLGVILMYDITNAKTLDRLSEWCQMAKNYREEIPILLVGNKVDLEKNRQVSKEQIEKFTQDNNIGSSTEISVKLEKM